MRPPPPKPRVVSSILTAPAIKKPAIIIVVLEGGKAMPNMIPSGQLIKLLHTRRRSLLPGSSRLRGRSRANAAAWIF